MLRLRKIIALLLLFIWTPAISHCLLEDALVTSDIGCCESDGGSDPSHSGCATCFSVEKCQAKVDPTLLPAPRLLVLQYENLFPAILSLAGAVTYSGVLHHPDDAPPVPPADLIRQATVARPVRGPSQTV